MRVYIILLNEIDTNLYIFFNCAGDVPIQCTDSTT